MAGLILFGMLLVSACSTVAPAPIGEQKLSFDREDALKQRDRLIDIGLKATLFHWDDDALHRS